MSEEAEMALEEMEAGGTTTIGTTTMKIYKISKTRSLYSEESWVLFSFRWWASPSLFAAFAFVVNAISGEKDVTAEAE